jgi:hypothetical protein
MNRYYQLSSWILAAPLVGAIQAIASMFPVVFEHGDLGKSRLAARHGAIRSPLR